MGYDDATLTRFRDTLRRERERQRLTQGQLAEMMTQRGVPARWSLIAKVEAGDRGVSIGEAAAIADAFGVSVDKLCGLRARPAADRAFTLRELAESVEDAMRSVRTSARDIGNRLAELGSTDAELAETGRKLAASLERSVSELAHYGATIAEKRSTRRRVLKEQGWADA
jgi:transcriptional regulator with XRE-family HTH domain